MVDYSSNTLDSSFYALSDPTRRAMLARIAKGETTVTELAHPFDMSLAAISKHLQVLERANFISKSKSGRTITCKANLAPLGEVMELLEELGRYWNKQLDSLERYLANDVELKGANDGKEKARGNTNSNRKTRGTRKKR